MGTQRLLAQQALRITAIAGMIAVMFASSYAETFYLVDDFGVQGKYRRCKYSNGKVYGLPASEPACYDSIEARSKPAARQDAAPLIGSGSTVFRNCSEARAAGAAPVRRGDPGYSPKLDRDGDGVGCE